MRSNLVQLPARPLLLSDSYKTTFSLSKDGNRISIDFDGEFGQELKFGQEVTSSDPVSGLKMKTVAWRTGPNSFTQSSRLEEAGIIETVSYVFYPSGAQVSREGGWEMMELYNDNQVNTKVARPSENQEAQLTEWYERLN